MRAYENTLAYADAIRCSVTALYGYSTGSYSTCTVMSYYQSIISTIFSFYQTIVVFDEMHVLGALGVYNFDILVIPEKDNIF